MQNITIADIDIQDITKENLRELSYIVSNRQKDKKFMRFLKETPMTPKQNLEIFQKEFDTTNCKFKSIKVD